jgi:hypothetical protein
MTFNFLTYWTSLLLRIVMSLSTLINTRGQEVDHRFQLTGLEQRCPHNRYHGEYMVENKKNAKKSAEKNQFSMRGGFRTSHVQQGYNTLITWSGSYSVWGPPHVKWVLYPCCTCNVHLSFSILNCTICTYFDIDLKRLYSSEGDLLVSVDANLFGVDSLG